MIQSQDLTQCEEKRFLGSVFAIFVLLRGHFCTNLHEILAPGLKLILPATLFYKKNHLTKRSRVNDPHILAQKQPKMAIFEKS